MLTLFGFILGRNELDDPIRDNKLNGGTAVDH